MIKRLISLLFFYLIIFCSYSQSYNLERNALEQFLIRMYNNNPFEGIKIVSDYDTDYLLSVVLVRNNESDIITNRSAQVKNQRQLSQFLSSNIVIDSETIITTREDNNTNESYEEITDIIKENSIGFAKSMEILTSFIVDDSTKCYMFYRELEDLK